MNAAAEQILMSKIRTLPPQQVSEVEDFVDFLTAKERKRSALDRLLAIAPALQAAGVAPMSEDEIAAEINAARAERRARHPASISDQAAGSDRQISSRGAR
jgi:hypothetical protein